MNAYFLVKLILLSELKSVANYFLALIQYLIYLNPYNSCI